MIDLDKCFLVDGLVELQVKHLFDYQTWDEKQVLDGIEVRKALAHAFLQILSCVPPCSDRSSALRKLREARMDCNSAITHKGTY